MPMIKAIRGMKDVANETAQTHAHILNTASRLLEQAQFAPILLPIVEKTELFARAVGGATDIVEKEMYTFADRNQDSLSLRPEGTAGCVRAIIENGLVQPGQVYKALYHGPMFRHERPQKGRYRQFYQLGAEYFGNANAYADAELITLCARIFDALGIRAQLELQLNSLGSHEDRSAYKAALVDFLKQHENDLDEDSQRRLHTNPLRILDSKNESTQRILESAPTLASFLSEGNTAQFNAITQCLDACGIAWTHNPHLVRGLDYYNDCVFEWVSQEFGTVCGGGRYDGLVELIGGKPTPATGFAMGLDRIRLLLEALNQTPNSPDSLFVVTEPNQLQQAFPIIDRLRTELPQTILATMDNGSFKSQFKKADKSNAQYALIIGEQELQDQTVTLKSLRGNTPQQTIPLTQCIHFFKEQTS